MPLASLPNLLDDTVHDELDRAVNEAASELLPDTVELLDSHGYGVLLLTCIVGNSDGDLHPKYMQIGEASALIKAHEDLMGLLSSAWEKKSYREIRNLAILKATQADPVPSVLATHTHADLHKKLTDSFKAVYHGAAVSGFYEYLTHNEMLFKTDTVPGYYAKFCSIVQSSGTGKSRMLTELKEKGVVVIYMNLDDTLGFPTRDRIPSEILTHFPSTELEYRSVCHAFFTALFDTVQECLSVRHATRTTATHWNRQMCDMNSPARHQFFKRVFEKYVKVRADLLWAVKEHGSKEGTMGTDIDDTTDKIKELIITDATPNPASDPPDFAVPLFSAYDRMWESLKETFPDDPDRPKLVIALDEAHPLTLLHQETYHPADVLCGVINGYSHHKNHAVWVAFASTTSKVADFSPPNQQHNSNRIAVHGKKLFQPYTQLGWDHYAPGLRDVRIEDVSQIQHIAGYGRPLWISLKKALTLPARVVDAAASKLCGATAFDSKNTEHVLAVLGQRFALNITFGHPDSVKHLESGVASHLLVCLSTTLDRDWRFTSYPSEPLLSCAAAHKLHELPTTLEPVLDTFLQSVNSGMIDMGQRGELASRLLWLLGKDFFVRKQAGGAVDFPSAWDGHLHDCQMISVVDWLEFVFGPQLWDGQGSRARTAFVDAYLNFSHWVCMDAHIAGSKEGGEMCLEEWTLRHWQRTSAVQCCHGQPLIDKVIPIYFKNGPADAPPESRMSQIFISDKARESGEPKDGLHIITRTHDSIGGASDGKRVEGSSETLPYIAILADLAQPPSFDVTFRETDVDDPCMRIYAAGVEPSTYLFLTERPALAKALKGLVRLTQSPHGKTPVMEYLNAQVKFGSTATVRHMEWEHGKLVPDVTRGSV